MIKIDKNVPIPEQDFRPRTYPWSEMEIGDSFFVAKELPHLSIPRAIKEKGLVFVRRIVTENDVKGTRVWRKK